jgi:tetratricopeptide (TPR) repeat protein
MLRVCSEAIERNSRDAGAYHHRAHTHERLGQWREAIADYAKAIDLKPQNLSWRVCRGRAYLRMGQKDKAAEDFRQAGELKPKEANNLAWELANSPNVLLRDPGLAVELAQQAVRQAPKEALYWNTLGVAHYRAGEWEAAIKALEEAETLAPAKYFGFNALFLAMCHHQLGDSVKAKDYYDRAVLWCQENQGKLSAAHQEELKRFRAEAEERVK